MGALRALKEYLFTLVDGPIEEHGHIRHMVSEPFAVAHVFLEDLLDFETRKAIDSVEEVVDLM